MSAGIGSLLGLTPGYRQALIIRNLRFAEFEFICDFAIWGLGLCSAVADLVHRPNFSAPDSFSVFRAERAGLHHGNRIFHDSFFHSLRIIHHAQNSLGRESVLFHLQHRMLRPFMLLGIFRNFELHKKSIMQQLYICPSELSNCLLDIIDF